MSSTSAECKNNIGPNYKLQFVALGVCLISCISSVFIFFGSIFYKREASSSARMRFLVYINMCGFIYCFSLFLEALLLSLPNPIVYPVPWCQIQAFLSNTSIMAMQVWSLCFTLHLYYALVKKLKYQTLKKIYQRLEYIFIVISFIVIPLPYFMLMFPLPIGAGGTWVMLFGNSNKQWCDFTIQEPSSDEDEFDDYEKHYGIYWEMGLFYLPAFIMFLINMFLYIRIMIEMRRNSQKLYERQILVKQRQQQEEEERQKKLKEKQEGRKKKKRPKVAATPSATPTESIIRSNSKENGLLTSPVTPQNNNKVLSSVSPIEYYNPLLDNKSGPSTALEDEEQQDSLLPFHFQLAQVTLYDIEEYAKFLQAQTRTASYYIAAFIMNWVIWVVARLTWEFAACNSSSLWVFIVILIVLQCSGPRIECILLSLIYGISESTVSPQQLRDVLVDITCLRYFTAYCASYAFDSELHKRRKTPIVYTTIFNKSVTTEPRAFSTNNVDNHQFYYQTGGLSKKISAQYDNILFFWFDVMRFKQLVKNYKEFMQNSPMSSAPTSPASERAHTSGGQTSEYHQHQQAVKKKQIEIVKLAQEICSMYMSEAGALTLPIEVCSNKDRNQIRTYVLQIAQNFSVGDADDDFDEAVTTETLEFIYKSDGDGVEQFMRPTIKWDHFSSINAKKAVDSDDDETEHPKSKHKGKRSEADDNSSSSSDDEEDDKYEDDTENVEKMHARLVDLFSKPAMAASNKLNDLMDSFKLSPLYSELCHLLRMKAEGKQRSLYRDLILSMFHFCTKRLKHHAIERSFVQTAPDMVPLLYNFIRKEKDKKKLGHGARAPFNPLKRNYSTR